MDLFKDLEEILLEEFNSLDIKPISYKDVDELRSMLTLSSNLLEGDLERSSILPNCEKDGK